MLSQEYISAIAILVISIFKLFHIEVTADAVTGIITGALAIWIAIRRYQKGDITLGGIKKY